MIESNNRINVLAATGRETTGQKSNKESSRDKILKTATHLFAAQGYTGVSMRDIAHACDIGLPSIYHFFGDKDRLYASCREKLFNEVGATLCNSLKEGASSHDRVRLYAIALCHALLINHDFRRLSQMEALEDERPAVDGITAPYFESPFNLVLPDIAALTKNGTANERALLINALIYGQVQLRRVAQRVGADFHHGNPEKLAVYVLNIALPGHDWSR